MSEKTISRQTALEALAELAYADAMLATSNFTTNKLRTDVIAKLEEELGVKVRTGKDFDDG
tara:strand:+ start:2927 stop:3109 length:183 start_codon:yes stop_codon:yes gene_type:complete